MKWFPCILGLLALAAAAASGGSASPSAPTPPGTPGTASSLAPQPESPGCKPDAPVRVELSPRDLVGGRTRVDYVVVPVVDALDVDVEVVLLDAGAIDSHVRPSLGGAARGTELRGSVAARFDPAAPSAELEVRASIAIPDPDGVDGIAWVSTTERVTWGTPDRTPDNVERVVLGDEVTLSVPTSSL